MFAIIAAILFAVALLIDLVGANTGPILDVGTLTLAGFLCVALGLMAVQQPPDVPEPRTSKSASA